MKSILIKVIEDSVCIDLCSVAQTRGVGFISKPLASLCKNDEDKIIFLCSKDCFTKLLDECTEFQSFTSDYKKKMISYFQSYSQEIDLTINASYTPIITTSTILF